ncbi:MAG: propanediol utilization protein [Candidatus Buchananbacteria bacterium]|nr:propanediol utilization protein [Candidatus Buchananbacteria bacterium]
MKVIVEVSGHHCHLSGSDLAVLFGKNYQLKFLKPVSQPGQFVAKEKVDVKISRFFLRNVSIIGPARGSSIVEISPTENYLLKGNALTVGYGKEAKKNTGGLVEIIGPKGKVKSKALIIPQRHIHVDPKTAQKLKLKTGQKVSVKVSGKEAVTFHNVLVRVDKNFKTRVHLNTDEGNAAGIVGQTLGELII